LRRVGLPADGMSHFLKRIETKEKLPPAFLSSHPNNLERMAALNDLVGGLGSYPNQPLGVDWNRVEHDLARQYVK